VVTIELGPETAVFVPRGVANGYQTLTDDTVYSYLVNAHWSPHARDSYSYLNLADETAAIDWPIPLAQATISDADAAHPRLPEAKPVPPKQTLIVGCGGQLGRALTAALPGAVGVDLPDFDLTDPAVAGALDWDDFGTIINASAYTAVDLAETPEGRKAAWAANVDGVARLCRIAAEHRITLVHVSTDYVFDGAAEEHDEDEPFSPLGVYGQTKAAADTLVAQLARHYIVRTSWVIGQGRNFVATMAELAAKGVSPTVVADQYGRLTFTTDLAAGIIHLLTTAAPHGTYNLTNTGPVQSWADIAADVFELSGRSRDDVTPITTGEYAAGKLVSPRPVHSALNLSKLAAAGFTPAPAAQRLSELLGARPPQAG
jgi:dTDP-4-dehydrorhamnose 3,5-epimerase